MAGYKFHCLYCLTSWPLITCAIMEPLETIPISARFLAIYICSFCIRNAVNQSGPQGTLSKTKIIRDALNEVSRNVAAQVFGRSSTLPEDYQKGRSYDARMHGEFLRLRSYSNRIVGLKYTTSSQL